MGDRLHSEDDNVEKDTTTSDTERVHSAGGPDLPVENRLVSEPPAPGSPKRDQSTPPQRPSAFTEWLTDWEDVRPAGSGPDPVAAGDPDTGSAPDSAADGADAPDDAAGDAAEDAATGTFAVEERAAEDRVVEERPVEAIEPIRRTQEIPRAVVDTPAARIPSPPPVRSAPDQRATSSRPIRASRPRPVSEASATTVGNRREFLTSPADAIVERGNVAPADEARYTTSRSVRIGGLDVTVDATQRAMLVTAALGMVVVAGLFAYLLSGLGSTTDTANRQADVETVAGPAGPDLNVSASSPTAPSISELARATVRIAGLDENGQTICAGSGVLVGEEGVILTNAHVITIDEDCPFATIAVGVTLDASDPPELLYRGEALVVDDVLDLAVVRIVGLLTSDDPLEIEPNFPVAVLGDSDKVELGDAIGILGYPMIGGVTITHTTGTVAGFVAEDGKNRALIKTDASISAGNSGGMAVNEAGEVIGIPTKAGANGQGPSVDCRAVSDTNNDGRIDTDDACVPIGGFLNSIRPISLAQDVLSRAEAIQQDAGRSLADAGSFDLSQVSIWNPRFSTGVESDAPVEEVITLTQGVEEICLFVDWGGIPNGVPWAAVWTKDGEKINEFSIFKVWEYGESGRNFWYCAEDRRGHPAGVYEVGLFLNDELAFVEAIEITEKPVDTFNVTWVNKSDQDICGLSVNPLANSRHAGVNVLPQGTIMGPGDFAVVELPAGDIVVEAYDCSGMAIASELDGLSIPESMFVDGEEVPFVIGGSASGGAQSDGDG